MFGRTLAALTILATSAFAHSNLFQPTPRQDVSSAYQSRDQNACGFDGTNVPGENVFSRGQLVPVKWWWNNHDGGFVKFSLIKDMKDFVGAGDQDLLLRRENTIQGQCYTRSCNRNGFDPGNTHECVGRDLEIPNWVSDGTYILQWSHFGGFNSEAVPSRQLPIYHTCANIRIEGGSPLEDRPSDWIAPFFGGDVVQANGQSASNDQCAFKNFSQEPDPSQVNVRDDDFDDIRVGGPTGDWAVAGPSNAKRADMVHLPRLGHIARRHNNAQ